MRPIWGIRRGALPSHRPTYCFTTCGLTRFLMRFKPNCHVCLLGCQGKGKTLIQWGAICSRRIRRQHVYPGYLGISDKRYQARWVRGPQNSLSRSKQSFVTPRRSLRYRAFVRMGARGGPSHGPGQNRALSRKRVPRSTSHCATCCTTVFEMPSASWPERLWLANFAHGTSAGKGR